MQKTQAIQKPEWIKVTLKKNNAFEKIRFLKEKKGLATVCEEAKCPNISKCWTNGTATFMVLGNTCTRGCRFCAVKHNIKGEKIDKKEPKKLAETIKKMNLKYAVITSVDRDDLKDQGANHIARCIKEIKKTGCKVEALVPDFKAEKKLVKKIINSKPEVFAHNIETVERLQQKVRDPRANYNQSIKTLEIAKKLGVKYTKSSIMVGLGETKKEVCKTMDDLKKIKTDFLTIGQYLQPTKNNLPVKEFVPMKSFLEYKKIALEKGFKYCVSFPLARSSYNAGTYYERVIKKCK